MSCDPQTISSRYHTPMRFVHKLAKSTARIIPGFFGMATTVLLLGGIILVAGYYYLDKQLPDVAVLKNVQFQVPLRIYTNDGKLIAEYGEKRRIPVSLDEVPKPMIQAFIATEDRRFYEHAGVDPVGLMRAAVNLVLTGKKSQGGSTITMQVARNFFLTRKKTYSRKLHEIMLALKINRELSKDKILELYLNKIYLGNRAYGVGAAARVYYGKTLNQLTLPQMAMIAGLPKAPSALNPLANPKAAKDRRNHVLERMYEQHYINKTTYEQAINTPITASFHQLTMQVQAPYIAEMARDTMVALFGEKAYTEGFKVYTTVTSQQQIAANKSLHDALLAYDQRHGYRGPDANWGTPSPQTLPKWQKQLSTIPVYNLLLPAVVTKVNEQDALVLLADGQTVDIPWQGLSWARRALGNNLFRTRPKLASDVLKPGDVIRVEATQKGWRLSQIPEAEAALVALQPDTGAITAIVGGFDFKLSKFNRATQAERQAGSSFKPFVYSAALAKGYTLATIINDAPVVYNDPSQENLWRPQNDTRKFYGPTRLRVGLIKSRNLVSIRLLESVGVDYAVNYVSQFGFNSNNLPHSLSIALGTGNVTPLEMARGYATFANGGYRITPYFISEIDDSRDNVLFKAHPKIACPGCNSSHPPSPELAAQLAPRIISPQVAYLMTSAMKSVIDKGTGRAALNLDRTDLAGKTGTTNNQVDAWFGGFNSDVVTIAWLGFDQPRSLYEYGSQAALPMWMDFMSQALANKPEASMPEPPGLIAMRIDGETGLPANVNSKDSIFETFRQQYAPQKASSYAQSTNNQTVTADNLNNDNDTNQLF